MVKVWLILLGGFATVLAIAGAVLPGLPTTPFLLVALWAFARSSERLHNWLLRVPLLQSALKETRRFEEKRAIRPAVKVLASTMAWGSVLLTYWSTGGVSILFVIVTLAALVGTLFIIFIPTDRT